jgi:site-specific DNA recombinase
MTLRCAAYMRYSTDKQNALSNPDQLAKCREYAQQKGWQLLEEHSYADPEISGATLERPELRKLLKAIESQPCPFDVILVEDASRLSRKQADVLNLCDRLRFAGVRICFVSQGIDSSDEKFQLLLLARGMIDQLFLSDTSKRVRRGMEGLVRRGLHTGGRCFGYRRRKDSDGTRLEINDHEAAIVQRIFQMYAGGLSLKQCAKALNREAIASPQPARIRKERSWSPPAVRHILRNERYLGKVVWSRKHKVMNPNTGRRVFRVREGDVPVHGEDAPHLRIVPDDLWDKVRARILEIEERYGYKSRRGLVSNWQVYGSKYLFSGLLRCGVCKSNITIVSGGGKNSSARYGCPMHYFRGTCSNNAGIRRETLEKTLLEGLQTAVLRPEVVEYTLSRFESELKSKLSQMTGELEGFREQKRELETQVNRLTEMVALGTNTEPPAAVLAGIVSRQREIEAIHQKLLSTSPDSIEARIRDIRQFVVSRLIDIRQLLGADVFGSKAELRKHIDDAIELNPEQRDGEKILVASGEWNLLGGYRDVSRKSGGAGGES